MLAFYGDWSEPSMYDRGTLLELISLTSSTTPYLYQTIGPYGNALAYSHADGKLYVQYYSEYNREARPYLATIDMHNAEVNP